MKTFDIFERVLLSGPRFNFKLGEIYFEPSYLQAVIIIALIFVLIITLAQVRRHFLDWSVKGAVFGLAVGFILAIVLEGFLVLGGRTAVTNVLGWKNPPGFIGTFLDKQREQIKTSVCK